MKNAIWQDILSEQDLAVIDKAGYATRGAATFSSRGDASSPALVIIDMQKLFVGEDVPILEAIASEATMIGEVGWRAIDAMQPLITQCRAMQIPVIYARMLPHNRPNNDPILDFVSDISPQTEDTIIEKTSSSIFFKTNLLAVLHQLEIDSLILIGNSTSGCIRAAAVDAVQNGFSAIVPHDCVFDRIEASHKISLLDMWMKYARVTSSTDLIAKLEADALLSSKGQA